MNIKAVLNKTEYSLSAFALLAMLSLIYDSFESVVTSVCRLLLCASVALFLSLSLNKKASAQAVVFPAFLILSVISCNEIFLTRDIHILLSLSSFFIALYFNEKQPWLTVVFAGLCVMAQPLTILLLVPTIVMVQLIKKQTIPAVVSLAVSIGAFVITRLLTTNTNFYSQQSGAYYLWIHPVFFSATHTEYLLKYLVCSIPLVVIILFYIVKLIADRKTVEGLSLILIIILALYGFSLCKNIHTVIMIYIPIFSIFILAGKYDPFTKPNKLIESFFTKNILFFVLIIALTAALPMILSNLPFSSDFFDKSTFIIFREE